MKLTKKVNIGKEGTKSAGKEFTTHQIGKMNEFGDGMIADAPLTGKFAFEPRIQKNISFFDKKTNEQKTFNAVTAVIQLANVDDFENVELNEYGSAPFIIPEKFIDLIEANSPVKGKGMTITLKSFEDKEHKKKTVWTMDIEGQTEQTTLPVSKGIDTTQIENFEKAFVISMEKAKKQDNATNFKLMWFAQNHKEEYLQIKEYADKRVALVAEVKKDEAQELKLDDKISSEEGSIPESEVDEETGNIKD